MEEGQQNSFSTSFLLFKVQEWLHSLPGNFQFFDIMTRLHQCSYEHSQTIIKQWFNHLHSNWPNKSELENKLPTLSSEFSSLLAIFFWIPTLKHSSELYQFPLFYPSDEQALAVAFFVFFGECFSLKRAIFHSRNQCQKA